jgi:hypothetical protein
MNQKILLKKRGKTWVIKPSGGINVTLIEFYRLISKVAVFPQFNTPY